MFSSRKEVKKVYPSNMSLAVSVSKLKPYLPQEHEKKVKPARPVTSKGRSNTLVSLLEG